MAEWSFECHLCLCEVTICMHPCSASVWIFKNGSKICHFLYFVGLFDSGEISPGQPREKNKVVIYSNRVTFAYKMISHLEKSNSFASIFWMLNSHEWLGNSNKKVCIQNSKHWRKWITFLKIWYHFVGKSNSFCVNVNSVLLILTSSSFPH